jgi:transcriptional regulator of arginine metabolism
MSVKDSIAKRQEAIRDLLGKELISDQKDIVRLLYERYGIETNQAVVSRDLRRLGVTKKEVGGELAYELPLTDVRAEILRLAIVDIEHNEVMIVINTHPGLADFVGDSIDQADLDILGCLSGENVVFITPRSVKKITDTYKAVCAALHFKKLG